MLSIDHLWILFGVTFVRSDMRSSQNALYSEYHFCMELHGALWNSTAHHRCFGARGARRQPASEPVPIELYVIMLLYGVFVFTWMPSDHSLLKNRMFVNLFAYSISYNAYFSRPMWGGPVVHITLESGIWHAIQLVIRSQNADAPPCTYSMQLRCPSCNWLICCRCLPIWNVTPFFSLCESKRHISALFTRTWNGILKLSKHVPAPVDRRSSTP